MRNPSEADVVSTNRVDAEPSTGRSALGPAVEPMNLESGRDHPSEDLPFAPGGEPTVFETNPDKSLLALAAAFRWRRPLLIMLAVAIAASVALASQRTVSVDSEGRTSGAMSASDSDDERPESGRVADGAASQVVGDGAELQALAEEAGTDSQPGDSSNHEGAPLQVTTPSNSTTIEDGQAPTRSSVTRSNGPRLTTAAPVVTSSATAADVPSTGGAVGDTTVGPARTDRRSATGQTDTSTEVVASSDQATATASTTTRRPTTTEQTTTTRRTTTTIVLIGSSAGGFENPSIDQDMVWLDNGDVGRWRSTNGDIQLMRSGFEGIDSIDGGQFAELNSSSQAGLYRTLTVEPGTMIEWEFLHRARSGTEQLEIRVDDSRSGEQTVDTVQATTQWVTHSGRWRVPEGATSVRFMLWSTKTGPYGNLIDAVRVVAAESQA